MTVSCLPNLPDNLVSTVLCGDHPLVRNALEEMGIEVLTVPDCDTLPFPVRNHADMICCHAARNTIVTADRSLAMTLAARGVDCRVTASAPGNRYPDDISLNCLVAGNNALGRKDALAPELLDIFMRNGTTVLSVKQGYARCSVAVVDKRSVITADKGIADSMTKAGYDVLLICPGHIMLEGYDTGFIGGCCGKISADRMLFCGDPAFHPDGERILSFLSERDVSAECTHHGDLIDFGGFIALMERVES